jgi:hypothetical protein
MTMRHGVTTGKTPGTTGDGWPSRGELLDGRRPQVVGGMSAALHGVGQATSLSTSPHGTVVATDVAASGSGIGVCRETSHA